MGLPELSQELQAVRLRARGQVQGVGFRPYIYRLATELRLNGRVRNSEAGVEIVLQGEAGAVGRFQDRLRQELPPLARIDELHAEAVSFDATLQGFVITESAADGAATAEITPDAALCPECLNELLDPADRRYCYPFINCTHCGPRYTITRAVPYDRPNTSMSRFRMCPECRAEYDDPLDRRFHAQPNACPECGPALELVLADGAPVAGEDPIKETVARLRAGEIVAIKGLGGYHLACDARQGAVVEKLRERKERDGKPFAVMVANIASLKAFTQVDAEAQVLLESAVAPIVLLPKIAGVDDVLPGIARDVHWLGAMLPYTPIHHLLFHEAAGRPEGSAWREAPQDLVLVMTSANPGGEPLVIDNREAQRRLRKIADAVLMHNRDILLRCDDSVVRHNRGRLRFIRRARGFTPQAIQLPHEGPSVLATGGWFKNTICVTRGDQAYVSAHIGDLDNAASCQALEENVQHMLDVLNIQPQVVVHDQHPDFFSTRFAEWFASEHRISKIAVQHHHAHAASVMADNGLTGRTLALSLDGLGLGADGELWGGELLGCDGAGYKRLAHLRPLALPGGDKASREPWRMAASVLHELGRGAEIESRYPHQEAAPTIRQMLQKSINSPRTPSAGRLFDAVAGILGIREQCSYEAEAAMALESLAEGYGPIAAMEGGYLIIDDLQLDLMPLLARLFDIENKAEGAALFHATLARGLGEWIQRVSHIEPADRVTLSGGCFLNELLATQVRQNLEQSGLEVFEARQVPANDGGLSLGQAWIIMARSQYEQ